MDFRTPLTNATQACAGCQALEADDAKTVTLLGGAVVCNTCPAWLEECRDRAGDVYHVLDGLHDKAARQRYLAAYGEQHGAEAEARLRAAVLQMHELRRKRREQEEAEAAGAVPAQGAA